MDRAIEEAANMTPTPTAIVVVTDGYTPWPDKPVRPNVVVALTRPENSCYPVPSWMTKIEMKEGTA